ncbi:pyrroline-5-carboxylate reductase [Maricaulis sp. W15]|uniref:Pyrroline-5-carboxylate reductase n=1 Tax=Maricaulis maris TaxID=74318 RepID=A0A495D3B2_9PROT|nr:MULTISPECIES: pyrroline-5-carboxylate reductase [Maricaulis]OLF71001.1 pyrroline-5-carboxylate reductase [Maricaulis sp. W15]RKQ96243.1 pyrroline-5-carboxylate reductase [Maricaulis maris]
MDILLIGCGKMGGAMLRRWLDAMPARFTTVNRSGRALPAGTEHVDGADALAGRRFDAIIIAVKPQQIPDVLPDYSGLLAEGGCLVSIAAGFSVASIARVVGDKPILRLMPNLPALIGRSVNGLYANTACDDRHRDLGDQLARTTGTPVWLDSEDELDRLTAVAGSGPGYVFEIARSYIAAAESLGFSKETARALVLETMGGAIEMASRSDQDVAELRNSVMSKKGTTEAGINALRRDGQLETLMTETVQAAYDRAVELR